MRASGDTRVEKFLFVDCCMKCGTPKYHHTATATAQTTGERCETSPVCSLASKMRGGWQPRCPRTLPVDRWLCVLAFRRVCLRAPRLRANLTTKLGCYTQRKYVNEANVIAAALDAHRCVIPRTFFVAVGRRRQHARRNAAMAADFDRHRIRASDRQMSRRVIRRRGSPFRDRRRRELLFSFDRSRHRLRSGA
jgi:hypothetical protein